MLCFEAVGNQRIEYLRSSFLEVLVLHQQRLAPLRVSLQYDRMFHEPFLSAPILFLCIYKLLNLTTQESINGFSIVRKVSNLE